MKSLISLITSMTIAVFAFSFTGNNLDNLEQEDPSPHECSSSCSHLDDFFKIIANKWFYI